MEFIYSFFHQKWASGFTLELGSEFPVLPPPPLFRCTHTCPQSLVLVLRWEGSWWEEIVQITKRKKLCYQVKSHVRARALQTQGSRLIRSRTPYCPVSLPPSFPYPLSSLSPILFPWVTTAPADEASVWETYNGVEDIWFNLLLPNSKEWCPPKACNEFFLNRI